MAKLAKLIVSLEAESSRLVKELEKANKKTDSWQKKTQKSVDTVKNAFIGLAGAYGINALKNYAIEQIKVADNIGKTADKLGISTKALQQYRFAAEQSGVATNVLDMGMQRFTRRVAEAQQGQGELRQTLEQSGIALRNANGTVRSSEDILVDYANAIKGAESEQEKLRLAFKGFDSEGAALVNLFRNGAEGVDKFKKEAEELGIILDDSMIRGAEEANNKLNILSRTLSIQATQSVIQYSGEISSLVDQLLNFMKAAAEAPKFIKFLAEGFAAFIHGPADLVRVQDRLAKLNEELALYSEAISAGTGRYTWLGLDELSRRIAKVAAERDELLAKQEFLTPPPLPLKEESVGSGIAVIEAKEERDRTILEMEYALQDKLLAVREQKAQQYALIQKRVEEQVSTFRSNTVDHAVNLLYALGQKSKAFAIAAIVVEKAIAIQRVLIQSKVAAMAALTPPPIGLGPVAGAGLAASITASGYASAGLIAATGALQLSNLGDSGGSVPSIGGGASSNIDTTNSVAQGQTGQTTFIIVGGGGSSEAELDQLMSRVSERLNEGSQVIIRRDSVQAQEILAAVG